MSNANTPETLAHSMAQSLLLENESLRAEILGLKEQLQNVDALSSCLHHDKEALTKQLAAANGRVDRLEKAMWDISQGNARVIPHADQCIHGRYGFEDCETCIADFVESALSDLPQQVKSEDATCEWIPMDNDNMPGTYEGTCGVAWSFIDGGIKDNDLCYCPRCGGKVVDVAAISAQEDQGEQAGSITMNGIQQETTAEK